MPALEAQYQFAAAFTVFLVALAGLALVALRSESLTGRASTRLALGAGFLAVGTGAFLSGSLLVGDRADLRLLALRGAGVLALFVGSIRWRGSQLTRALFWLGLAGLAVSIPLERLDLGAASAVASVAGALCVAAALLGASRRAIAARVAASAAATLLLVVLVLSVALSILLVNNVEDQAVSDLDSRSLQESANVEHLTAEAVRDAAVVGELLAHLRSDPADPSSATVLSQLGSGGEATDGQRRQIADELDRAGGGIFFGEVSFAYVGQPGRVVAGSIDPGLLVPIAGSPVVAEAVATGTGKSSTQLLGGAAYTVAAAPIRLRTAERDVVPLGAVVAVVRLDRHYLETRPREGDSLALVGREGVSSSFGPQPPTAVLRRAADEVLAGRRRVVRIGDGRFTVARPVRAADDRPILALIASRSSADVDSTRDQLFRTFFVIAFGGTVLALLLAAIVGDRIGAGIRRLTTAAEAIQLGDFRVRSGVRSEDEVGVLGATFDSMAASIEQQTDALAEAAARVEAIVAGMGEALVALDADGCITDFNRTAEDLVGLDAGAALGRTVDDVLRVTSEEGADLSGRLRALEAERWSALGTLRAHDGSDVPVAITSGPLRGPEGAAAGEVVVLRDLRGEREVERMKRHFLSRVGHELRTPLTPLIGYSQLLAGRELPPERARPVYASILSSARRLERIVEMLEFFASLDAGRDVLFPEPVDVRSLLATAATTWAEKADSGHTVAKRVARDAPRVMADPRWLARSVDELVDNALKFSPRGGRVTIAAAPWDEDPSFVEISVRDAGVGMSPEEVESAFTEWAQGDESDTRSFGGLGLGLALVQRVAERHGGRVACATAPGQGSKFSILLPALPTEEDGATRPGSAAGGRRRARRLGVPDGGAEPR